MNRRAMLKLLGVGLAAVGLRPREAEANPVKTPRHKPIPLHEEAMSLPGVMVGVTARWRFRGVPKQGDTVDLYWQPEGVTNLENSIFVGSGITDGDSDELQLCAMLRTYHTKGCYVSVNNTTCPTTVSMISHADPYRLG